MPFPLTCDDADDDDDDEPDDDEADDDVEAAASTGLDCTVGIVWFFGVLCNDLRYIFRVYL